MDEGMTEWMWGSGSQGLLAGRRQSPELVLTLLVPSWSHPALGSRA